MLSIVRWLGVLPGAFVCALLATFPLHWILYGTLTSSGIVQPYPEAPEQLLGPLVSALAFVWAGSWIAPFRKVEIEVVLLGALLLLIGVLFAFWITGTRIGHSQLYLRLAGLPPIGAVAGAFISLCLVRRKNAADLESKYSLVVRMAYRKKGAR
jgi:hypothetical protein